MKKSQSAKRQRRSNTGKTQAKNRQKTEPFLGKNVVRITHNEYKAAVPHVINILKTAKGRNKAVSNTKIRIYVRQQTGLAKLHPYIIRAIIYHIRITHKVPNLIASHDGYWITKDTKELEDYLKSRRNYIKQNAAIISALKKQGAQILGRQKQIKSNTITKKRKSRK